MDYKIKYFAKNLYNLRIANKLTQWQLGEKLNYSGKAISKWESGGALPPTEVILKIADIFNVDLNGMFASNEIPAYYLGVDGGGTSTEFVLTDSEGKIVKQCLLGPCNVVNMSVEKIKEVLSEGIKSVCLDIQLGTVSAFFGMAGAGTENGANRLKPIINRFGFANVSYGSDAENIISAGLRGKDGLIVILGTGSVVYCSKGKKLYRYGGYGHLLVDYCSGYEIGKCGINAVLRATDKSGEQTLLTSLFENKTGNNAFEMLYSFYEKDKAYIASFAPMVFEAYEKGDKVAKDIIDFNVAELSKQIKAALKNLDNDYKVPIVISGGVSKKSDLLIPIIEKAIGRKNIEIKVLNDTPVMGAVRLAKLIDGDNND